MGSVCSHQPGFLPWVGYWNKMALCQTYIALCGVDYAHHDVQNRTRLEGQWMGVGIQHSTKFQPISQVQLSSWKDPLKIARRIQQELMSRKNLYGSRLEPVITTLETSTTTSLMDLNLALWKDVAFLLQLETQMILDYDPPLLNKSRTENVVHHVTRVVPTPVYFAGQGALAYLDKAEISFPVMMQTVKGDVGTDTVLQVIAREPDPLDYVMMAADWEIWRG